MRELVLRKEFLLLVASGEKIVLRKITLTS